MIVGDNDETKRDVACYPRKLKKQLNNQLLFCGPGGSRTLVQTRKPYAFYMLISAFDFRV